MINNNKAFTLIELIVIMVMLGVILLFALPNITANAERNKKDAFINDAKDMIEKTKTILLTNKAFYPQTNEIVVFNLTFLDKRKEIVDSKYGVKYNRQESFVAVKKIENDYEYYVSLVACDQNKVNHKYKLDGEEVELSDGSIVGGFNTDPDLKWFLMYVTYLGIFSKNDNGNVTAPSINTTEALDLNRSYDINEDGYITWEYVSNSDVNIEDGAIVISGSTIEHKPLEMMYNYVCDNKIVGIDDPVTIDDINGKRKYFYVKNNIDKDEFKKLKNRVSNIPDAASMSIIYYCY